MKYLEPKVNNKVVLGVWTLFRDLGPARTCEGCTCHVFLLGAGKLAGDCQSVVA